MDAKKIFCIIGGIIIVFFLVSFILLMCFTNQDKEFFTDLNCQQIRECIDLKYNCVDKFVENNLFGMKWSFYDKAFFSDQKEYYKLNCMEFIE